MENIKSINTDIDTQSQMYLISLKIFVYAELPLVKAVAGCVYNSNFFYLPLLSGIHTMNCYLKGRAINVDCCLLMLC